MLTFGPAAGAGVRKKILTLAARPPTISTARLDSSEVCRPQLLITPVSVQQQAGIATSLDEKEKTIGASYQPYRLVPDD